MEYRIQSMCLPKIEKHMMCKELFFKGNGGYLDRKEGTLTLKYGQSCDLLTYINSLSWKKWKEFSFAKSPKLHLIVDGPCEVTFVGAGLEVSMPMVKEYGIIKDTAEGKREIVFSYPDNDMTLLSANMVALGDCTLFGGYFTVSVEDNEMRDIELSIATTTCRKEEFIKSNIDLLKEEILSGDDELKDHLEIHVVDNGNTLTEKDIFGEHISLHPNINAGGSGGFARGMIETIHQKNKEATHILIMDDDIVVLPESIKRTYHLLRILRPEYKDSFINGAMLRFECPNRQHEDLGAISPFAFFKQLKSKYDHTKLADVIDCSEAYTNNPNTYCAWWYCCFSTEVIKKNGFPMPFFLRGDDAEYALRFRAHIISMNGICVWHMGFTYKFNGAMDIYQHVRNLMIAQVSSDAIRDIDIHALYKTYFKIDLRKFNYNSSEQYLRAFEDYMKGPSFLESCNGEQIIKDNVALNEKYEPLSEHPEVLIDTMELIEEEDSRPIYSRIAGMIAWWFFDNGQTFSGFSRDRGLPVAIYDFSVIFTKMAGVKKYAAVNPYFKTVAIRQMDKTKYRTLKKRFKRIEKEYKKHGAEIARQYREAHPYFTSEEFWRKYLKLDEQKEVNE